MPSPDPPPTSLASDLRRLNWPRTADDLNDLIAQATQRRWSPTVLLERVVAAELEDRQRRSVERRLSAARLGRFKPMADWDWDWPTALDRRALERVLALDFLALPDNVLLVGAQGLGKTMLAKNIVHAAVLAGHTARFTTASDLLLDLTGKKPRGPSTAACSTIPGPHCSPSMRSDISRTMPAPRTSSFRSSVVATSIARS